MEALSQTHENQRGRSLRDRYIALRSPSDEKRNCSLVCEAPPSVMLTIRNLVGYRRKHAWLKWLDVGGGFIVLFHGHGEGDQVAYEKYV